MVSKKVYQTDIRPKDLNINFQKKPSEIFGRLFNWKLADNLFFSTKDCDMTTIGCFDKEENRIMFFDSARQAANKFDVEPSFVCSYCRNEKWALGNIL